MADVYGLQACAAAGAPGQCCSQAGQCGKGLEHCGASVLALPAAMPLHPALQGQDAVVGYWGQRELSPLRDLCTAESPLTIINVAFLNDFANCSDVSTMEHHGFEGTMHIIILLKFRFLRAKKYFFNFQKKKKNNKKKHPPLPPPPPRPSSCQLLSPPLLLLSLSALWFPISLPFHSFGCLSTINQGLPCLNLAGHPWSNYACDTSAPLYMCPNLGQDIALCQASGRLVLLSLGGAVGNYYLASVAEARNFARVLWHMFLGGGQRADVPRPFGDVVLDGFDLDIEKVDGFEYYDVLVQELRLLMAEDVSKQYVISAAPQCPYPSPALGPLPRHLLSDSPLDFVNVQFYNNPT